MTQELNPEAIRLIKAHWGHLLRPGEELGSLQDLARLQERIQGMIEAQDHVLEYRFRRLADVAADAVEDHRRLKDAEAKLRKAAEGLEKMARVFRRSLQSPQ